MIAVILASSRSELAMIQAAALHDEGVDFAVVRDFPALERALLTIAPVVMLLDLPLTGLAVEGLPALLTMEQPALVCASPEVGAAVRPPHRFLAQPYTIEEWMTAVRAVIARTPAPHLDLTTGTVSLGGRSVGLTPTEAQLFDLLLRANGQVLSVAEIVEALWGYAPDAAAADLVRAHLYQLRRRLAQIGLGEAIATLPRRGYRFVMPDGQ